MSWSAPSTPKLTGKQKLQWRKSENKNKALLDYRATPIPGIGLCLSQLSMGRTLRTTLSMATGLLKPETYNALEIKRSFQKAKDKQKYHYDRHSTRELPLLIPCEREARTWVKGVESSNRSRKSCFSTVVCGRYRQPRIRRNRVALRADRPESHAGYQRRHASTLQQPEPEQESDTPDTDTALQPPSEESLMRNPVQVESQSNKIYSKLRDYS